MRSLFLFPLACLFTVNAAAQVSTPSTAIPVGPQVSLEICERQYLTGRVVDNVGDTVVLEVASGFQKIPVQDIRSFAILRKADRLGGARRGALVGGLVGLAALGLAIWDDTHTRDERFIPLSFYVAPYTAGATLFGAAVGAVVVRDRWNPRVYVSVNPGGRVFQIPFRK